jgi:hypothetical protein
MSRKKRNQVRPVTATLPPAPTEPQNETVAGQVEPQRESASGLASSPVDIEQTAATGGMQPPSTPAPPNEKKTKKAEYAFPTKSRCPRCCSTQTKATNTKGDTQYRECQMPVCRHRYSVLGKKI